HPEFAELGRCQRSCRQSRGLGATALLYPRIDRAARPTLRPNGFPAIVLLSRLPQTKAGPALKRLMQLQSVATGGENVAAPQQDRGTTELHATRRFAYGIQ